MRRKPQPPTRRLGLFSRLIIRFGALYSTGGWLLLIIVSFGFWGSRWGLIESNLILSLVAVPIALLGGVSVVKSLQAGGLAVRLLRKGEFAWGTLVEVENTALQYQEKAAKFVNKLGAPGPGGKKMSEEELQAFLDKSMKKEMEEQPQSIVMKYHLKFNARDAKEYMVKAETTLKEGAKVVDEEREPVLYLPDNPNKAAILDAIYHAPEIWPDGSFAPLPISKAVYLILPFVAIGGNAFCLLMDFSAG